MAATVSLTDAQSRDAAQAVPVREIARKSTNGKTLAVCETGGALVLMRERAASADGKRPAALKRTARVADFADALDCGLIGS